MTLPGSINHFSNQGPSTAKIKLVIIGSSASKLERAMNRFRSLNQEHVSPDGLMRRGISQRTPPASQAGAPARRGQTPAAETTLALMRRWFWMRKPDAGFVLTGFPATLLQAKVFDEWLDARGESLDAVLDAAAPLDAAGHLVLNHYRAHGHLVIEDAGAPAASAQARAQAA